MYAVNSSRAGDTIKNTQWNRRPARESPGIHPATMDLLRDDILPIVLVVQVEQSAGVRVRDGCPRVRATSSERNDLT